LPPDPLTLGVDTSAAHCAAALLSGDKVIASRFETMTRGQAERLMPMLAELLAGADAGWRDLDTIGVGIGPGNFTGIRIAVAAARGLALSLGVPAVGVSTFQALAEGLPQPVLACVDARRDRCYVLAVGAWNDPLVLCPGALPPGLVDSGLDCVGDGAPAFARATGGQAVQPVMPLATAIARIATASIAAHDPHDIPRPAPLYVRGADAAPASDPPPVILP